VFHGVLGALVVAPFARIRGWRIDTPDRLYFPELEKPVNSDCTLRELWLLAVERWEVLGPRCSPGQVLVI
jgi:hypothetical protein